MVDKLRLEVLLAAVDKVTGPLRTIASGSRATAQAVGETEAALKKLQAQQRALARFEKERDRLENASSMLEQAKATNAGRTAVRQLTADYEKQLGVVKKLQADMVGRGWGDARVDQQQLANSIQSTNTQLDAQRRKLEMQQQTEERLHSLREKHSKAMLRMGMWGAAGAGMQMAGAKARMPVQAAIGAFMPAETAENQLSASMMDSTGAVPKEFAQIVELATRLGDRLPGTTADFIDMMTMLRRQGMSAQTVLGGLGEASAYLGVQLKMPVTAAAEFGAKMQDATQTAEKDMMGLMDMIQRSYYLGVDPTNMLQGFTSTAAVMPLLGKKGLEASNMIAPMLVMMDQAGMKGEAAGNAIRKVVQLSMDAEKLGKANKMLKGTGVQLEFFNKAGKFAGFDNLFAQLQKLKGIDSDVARIAVMKKLFGDDKETHEVLNNLMEKGLDGYREVEAKMKAQASLRQRVDASLETLAAKWEAAQGSFTNMLKELGAAIAPELKALLGWLADMANGIGAWAREHPILTKAIMLTVAAISALLTVAGALVIAVVAVLGPMHMAKFLLARWALGMVAARVAAMSMGGAVGALSGVVSGGLVAALRGAGAAMWALVANPVGLAIAGLALGALLVYKYWQPLKAFFSGLWAGFSEALGPTLTALATAFAPLRPVLDWFVGVLGAAWGWITKLLEPMQASQQQLDGWTESGRALGMVLGEVVKRMMSILSLVPGLGAAFKLAGWLGEKIGAGGGAAGQAIAQDGKGSAPIGMSGAAVLPISAVAAAQPRAAGALGSGQYNITVNAAPGMDEKAMARAITFEMDKREREQNSRRYSRLSDID